MVIHPALQMKVLWKKNTVLSYNAVIARNSMAELLGKVPLFALRMWTYKINLFYIQKSEESSGLLVEYLLILKYKEAVLI